MAELPEWARFFGSQERLDRFEAAVLKDMEDRGIRVAIENGWVWPMEGSGREGGDRWGLSNIGQRCAQEDEGEWAGLLERHFDSIFETQLETQELDFADFDSLRTRLSVRLWEAEALGDSHVCARDDIPGLRTCLCVDLERGIRGLTPGEAAQLGRPLEELFALAIENAIEASEVELQRVEFEPDPGESDSASGAGESGGDGAGENPAAIALTGDSPYISSHILRMDRYAAHLGAHGAIVAVPLRDVVVILPFEDAGVIGVMPKLMLMAARMYADGPGSVTASVYWYQGQEGGKSWTEIPYELSEQNLDIMPPPELIERLESLLGGAGEEGE